MVVQRVFHLCISDKRIAQNKALRKGCNAGDCRSFSDVVE